MSPATSHTRIRGILFITGGGTGGKASDEDHKLAFTLTKATGARVAVLHQVPNQPLLGDKSEDALIAETFVRYLETKDRNWPLLFPMVKSAVRAMDAVQAWAGRQASGEIKRFVVTGASRRGWTTWLTGAVDNRVIAIAPMVIVMLNMGAQGPNQLDVWGKYSEQIEDYVNRGLMERAKTREGTELWRMVDPFFLPRPATHTEVHDQRRKRSLLDPQRPGSVLERVEGPEIRGRASQCGTRA